MSFRWECPEGKCPEGRCTARRGRRRCCGHQAVESAEAHEDDGGLENRYLLDFRGAGQAEADLLVAAENVPLEAGTTQVTGAPLAGESGLAATIPDANKHAVVVLSVLIEKPSVHEGANDPWGKEIHEDPVAGRRAVSPWAEEAWGGGLIPVGGIPGSTMVDKKVIHHFQEAHAAELLEERDGVAALPGGVAPPGKAFLDADAVHLRRSVIVANPLQRVAQRGQQVRQVCVLGNVQLCAHEMKSCALIRDFHLLLAESKNSRAGYSQKEYPAPQKTASLPAKTWNAAARESGTLPCSQ